MVGAATAWAADTRAGQVAYAPAGNWVLPPPSPTDGAAPADAPFRFIYTDKQVRLGAAGQETYSAYRVRILKPEGLALGNLGITWNPSGGSATVHLLRIIRDGQVIDLLKDQRFKVIQREGGLEQSMLDGLLTATLQAPGLRVGDELEFAATIVERDPTLSDHFFGLTQWPVQGVPGAFRYRMSWPDAVNLTWRATRDLPQAAPQKAAGRTSIAYELRDPSSVILNEGAPQRYNIRRLIEFSDFSSWSDVSRRVFPLFDKAEALSAASPLRAEAAKIAAASTDPAERAQAALRLVQDQIRYVYVGLDGGNYRPAGVDETWQRRFGDCKAKTVMLLALLRALQIEAEPVLVNTLGDDGLDARLPSPAIFNHVLVRAKIGGASYWLDGTRLGDRHLDMLPAPGFRWALALRPDGSDLEKVTPKPLARPQFVSVVDIDASAGFDQPAKVKAQQVLRQDEAFATRTQLAGLSTQDADRALRSFWRQALDWVDPDTVSWRYDERRATLVLELNGQGKAQWEGNDADGRSMTIVGAGFYAPEMRRRPKDEDQSAPWQTEFPRFRCYATTIRLPAASAKWGWGYYADAMNRLIGGTRYWRQAGLKDGVVRTVMSSRIDAPEISAAEAAAANDAIASFNNKMSNVYQLSPAEAKKQATSTLPFDDGVDWSADHTPCDAAPLK